MHGEEVSSIKQSTAAVPTRQSLSIKWLVPAPILIMVAGGLYLTDMTLFASLTFFLALFIGSIPFALRTQRRPPQKQIVTNSTPTPSVATVEATPVGTSHKLPVPLPFSTAQPEIQSTDFRRFDLSASQPIDFNLRTTVEETVSRFTVTAKERGIELSCLFSSDSPTPFRGDPGDIRLILMNLIDYALSSVTHGEVTVRGGITQQTSTHATFRFSVSILHSPLLSSGGSPLMPSAAENREPAVSFLHQEGAIAISKQLVKTFGGQLEVEKTPDVDTTIWFTLTLEKQPPQVFSDSPPRASLSGTRVLLVGNDFSLSDEDVLRWGLTSHRVSCCSHAWSMLTTAARLDQAYDVVLIHCQELEADALDFATRARTTEALAALRLIFIATSGKKGDARLIRQAGYDAYLTYPVSPSLFFECLASVLGQAPQSPGVDLPLVTRYTLAEARTRGRSRILIVNSSLSEQKHAVRLVEALGYRADIALTAREAIEAHARLPYVAVLLPTQMPGIDGVAAATQIRQHDHQEGMHTPLIGVLQSPGDDARAQCLAAGMDIVVTKPLLLENLKATVDYCCSLAGGQQTALAEASTTEQEPLEVNFREALARIEGDTALFDDMSLLFFEEYPKALIKLR
jgi:CheY-like chemotaxis protein